MNTVIAALTRYIEPVLLLNIYRAPVYDEYGEIAEFHRLFALDAQTLINVGFILANVIIFAFVFTKILYRPMTNMMKKRTDKIEGQLKNAEESLASANEMKAEYERKLASVDDERTQILDAAYTQAEDTTHRKLEEAKQDAKAIVERAHKQAKDEIENMKNEVKTHIIEVSSLMAGKFVAKSMDDTTQNELFDKALDELGGATWPN